MSATLPPDGVQAEGDRRTLPQSVPELVELVAKWLGYGHGRVRLEFGLDEGHLRTWHATRSGGRDDLDRP